MRCIYLITNSFECSRALTLEILFEISFIILLSYFIHLKRKCAWISAPSLLYQKYKKYFTLKYYNIIRTLYTFNLITRKLSSFIYLRIKRRPTRSNRWMVWFSGRNIWHTIRVRRSGDSAQNREWFWSLRIRYIYFTITLYTNPAVIINQRTNVHIKCNPCSISMFFDYSKSCHEPIVSSFFFFVVRCVITQIISRRIVYLV